MLDFSVEGQGPAIFLLHGLFGNKDNLAGVGNALLEAGFQVIRCDLPNHGLSPMGQSMQLTDMAQLVELTRAHLQLECIAMLGHSLGGKVAMTYALAYPERVSALIVADIAPSAYRVERHQNILRAFERMNAQPPANRQQAKQVLTDEGIDLATAGFLLKNFRTHPDETEPRWLMDSAQVIKHYWDILGAVPFRAPYTGPVQFIKGERSDYLTAEHRLDVEARFPNAKARVIPNTGHWLHAEQPQIFNRHCVSFFSRHLLTATQ